SPSKPGPAATASTTASRSPPATSSTSPSATTAASGRYRPPDRALTARDLVASHPPPILPHKGGGPSLVFAGSTPHTRWSTLPLVGRVGEGGRAEPGRIGSLHLGNERSPFPPHCALP